MIDLLSRSHALNNVLGVYFVTPQIWLANTWKNFQIYWYNTAKWMLWGNNQEFAPYVKTEKLLDTDEMMKTLFMVHGHQIFVDGSFNGDPHPGNILLTEDGRIGLIDYGQVKHMPRDERVQLSKLIIALAHEDKESVRAQRCCFQLLVIFATMLAHPPVFSSQIRSSASTRRWASARST